MVMNVSEIAWVVQAKEGDRSAMHELYGLHRQRIYGLAYRYARNSQDAEDIMQNTFVKAFTALQKHRLSDDAFFATWLYRIGIHCAVDFLRQKKRRRETADADALDVLAGSADPERELWHKQVREAVIGGLDGLSPGQRTVFTLRHFEQLSIREIAAMLQCSEGSIKTQLSRALSAMRRRLKPLLGGG